MATSDQCALGPNGRLLDTSEIIWLNDPDDLTPLPPSSTHCPFMATGSQCSTCIPHPSKHVLDPDDSECPNVLKQPRISQQIHAVVELDSGEKDGESDYVDDGNENGGSGDTNVDSETVNVDLEAIEEAYAVTKAMGNADCEVCLYF